MEVLVHCIPDRWSSYALFVVLLQLFEKTILQKLKKNVFTNSLSQMKWQLYIKKAIMRNNLMKNL